MYDCNLNPCLIILFTLATSQAIPKLQYLTHLTPTPHPYFLMATLPVLYLLFILRPSLYDLRLFDRNRWMADS